MDSEDFKISFGPEGNEYTLSADGLRELMHCLSSFGDVELVNPETSEVIAKAESCEEDIQTFVENVRAKNKEETDN